MNRRFLFVLIFLVNFILMNFTFAEAVPYFSIKKVSQGLMVGVEIINQKTGKTETKSSGYSFSWIFPEISQRPSNSLSNVFFLPLELPLKEITINLKVSNRQQNLEFKDFKILKEPRVFVLRKYKGAILPLETYVTKEDSLILKVKDFSSKNLSYIWRFGDQTIMKKMEISASSLNGESGTLEVNVFGKFPNESGQFLKYLEIR